jgi:hypothetical protein
MHKSRIWIASIAGFGLLTPFLPWVNVMGLIGVSGTAVAQGWLVFIIFAAAVALALTGTRAFALDSGRRGGIAVLGVAAIGFGIWKMMEIKQGTIDLGSELNQQLRAQGGDGAEALGRGMIQMLGGSDQLLEMAFGVYAVIGAGIALVIAIAIKSYKVP